MRKHWIKLLFAFLFISNSVLSQLYTPKYSNEFLKIQPGPKYSSLASGEVYAEDNFAVFYNSALLSNQKEKYNIGLQHTEFFAGLATYDFVGLSTKIDSTSGFGVNIVRFAIDNIPDTRYLFDANGKLNYDNIKFFSAADYAFLLAYGKKSKKYPNLSVGGSLKVIYRQVGSFANAWGVGFNFGAHYSLKKFNFGVQISDITTTYTNWFINSSLLQESFVLSGNEVPTGSSELTLPSLNFATHRNFTIIDSVLYCNPILALFVTSDGQRNVLLPGKFLSMDAAIGTEISFKNIVFVRGSISKFQRIKTFESDKELKFQPAFGMGVKIKNLRIDYALSESGNESDNLYSHMFGLTLSIR